MKSLTGPNIYEYSDFRKYLNDYYLYKNDKDPTFTKTYVCKQLGLPNSRSYFQEVVKGRVISSPKIPLFISLLELNEDEGKFFRALVNYNQNANTQEEKEQLLNQLIRLYKVPQKVITEDEFSYYSTWYHSVIRSLLDVIDFYDDYAMLANKVIPPIRVDEAQKSIALLCDLNLIAQNDDGFYKPTHTSLTTGTLIKNELIKQYQLKCLDVAKSIIMNNDNTSQHVITKLMTVSQESLDEIKKSISKFNSEITAIVRKDTNPSDRVYEIDLLFYPHSRCDK